MQRCIIDTFNCNPANSNQAYIVLLQIGNWETPYRALFSLNNDRTFEPAAYNNNSFGAKPAIDTSLSLSLDLPITSKIKSHACRFAAFPKEAKTTTNNTCIRTAPETRLRAGRFVNSPAYTRFLPVNGPHTFISLSLACWMKTWTWLCNIHITYTHIGRPSCIGVQKIARLTEGHSSAFSSRASARSVNMFAKPVRHLLNSRVKVPKDCTSGPRSWRETFRAALTCVSVCLVEFSERFPAGV